MSFRASVFDGTIAKVLQSKSRELEWGREMVKHRQVELGKRVRQFRVECLFAAAITAIALIALINSLFLHL